MHSATIHARSPIGDGNQALRNEAPFIRHGRIAGRNEPSAILGELHRYGVAVIDLQNDELTQDIINA